MASGGGQRPPPMPTDGSHNGGAGTSTSRRNETTIDVTTSSTETETDEEDAVTGNVVNGKRRRGGVGARRSTTAAATAINNVDVDVSDQSQSVEPAAHGGAIDIGGGSSDANRSEAGHLLGPIDVDAIVFGPGGTHYDPEADERERLARERRRRQQQKQQQSASTADHSMSQPGLAASSTRHGSDKTTETKKYSVAGSNQGVVASATASAKAAPLVVAAAAGVSILPSTPAAAAASGQATKKASATNAGRQIASSVMKAAAAIATASDPPKVRPPITDAGTATPSNGSASRSEGIDAAAAAALDGKNDATTGAMVGSGIPHGGAPVDTVVKRGKIQKKAADIGKSIGEEEEKKFDGSEAVDAFADFNQSYVTKKNSGAPESAGKGDEGAALLHRSADKAASKEPASKAPSLTSRHSMSQGAAAAKRALEPPLNDNDDDVEYICDKCRVAKFASFNEACQHESICVGATDGEKSVVMAFTPRKAADEEIAADSTASIKKAELTKLITLCKQEKWAELTYLISINPLLASASFPSGKNYTTTILHQVIASKGDAIDRAGMMRSILTTRPSAAAVKNAHGNLPIHSLASSSRNMNVKTKEELFRGLIHAYPASLTIASGTNERTPLHIFVHDFISPALCHTLLTIRPEAAKIRDKEGWLPIHLACSSSNCRLEIVRMLLNAYPQSIGETTNDGKTPLMIVNGVATKKRPMKGVIEELTKRLQADTGTVSDIKLPAKSEAKSNEGTAAEGLLAVSTSPKRDTSAKGVKDVATKQEEIPLDPFFIGQDVWVRSGVDLHTEDGAKVVSRAKAGTTKITIRWATAGYDQTVDIGQVRAMYSAADLVKVETKSGTERTPARAAKGAKGTKASETETTSAAASEYKPPEIRVGMNIMRYFTHVGGQDYFEGTLKRLPIPSSPYYFIVYPADGDTEEISELDFWIGYSDCQVEKKVITPSEFVPGNLVVANDGKPGEVLSFRPVSNGTGTTWSYRVRFKGFSAKHDKWMLEVDLRKQTPATLKWGARVRAASKREFADSAKKPASTENVKPSPSKQKCPPSSARRKAPQDNEGHSYPLRRAGTSIASAAPVAKRAKTSASSEDAAASDNVRDSRRAAATDARVAMLKMEEPKRLKREKSPSPRKGRGNESSSSNSGGTTNDTLPEIRVGTNVYKYFGKKYYEGKITKLPGPGNSYYHIRYDDGDEEDMLPDEMWMAVSDWCVSNKELALTKVRKCKNAHLLLFLLYLHHFSSQ